MTGIVKRTVQAAHRVFAGPMNTAIAEFFILAILATMAMMAFAAVAGRSRAEDTGIRVERIREMPQVRSV